MKETFLIEYPHVPGIFVKYEDDKVVSCACDKNGKDLHFCLPDGRLPECDGILNLNKPVVATIPDKKVKT